MENKPTHCPDDIGASASSTDEHQLPSPIATDSSAYELLVRSTSEEEARVLRRILADWSQGDENTYPFQHALLTRAQWKTAAMVPIETAKLVEGHRAIIEDAAQRIAQVADEKIAELAQVGKLAQTLTKDVGVFRKYVLEIITQAEVAVHRHNQAAANFEHAQLRYLEVRRGSEWLAFSITLAFVAMLGLGIGFLSCHYLSTAQ